MYVTSPRTVKDLRCTYSFPFRHRWTRPALIPASQTGTWFTYRSGIGDWVHLDGWLYYLHQL